tara:strand:- start:906 stop:1475 length:570 start_codon:yes stop_codon:yes gene_type:complete
VPCHVEKLTTSSTSTGRIENSEDLDDLHPPFDGVYEALSYTWESSENPQEISVLKRGHVKILEYEMADSDQKENVLLVSQNLSIALQHLRQQLEDRILWRDAICINQQDVIERGIQVSRMGDIYRRARQVVIWLGPEEDQSSLALELINEIGRDLREDTSSMLSMKYQTSRRYEYFGSPRRGNSIGMPS